MLLEIKVPDLAESVPDATCLAWMKNEGDHITEGENLIDLETDKVTLEIVAPHSGMVISILKKEGEIVLSGDILATIDTESVAVNTSQSTQNSENIGSGEFSKNEKTVAQKIGPAVKKLLIEKEIDPNLIQGTGKDGRITKEDVNLFLKNSVTSEKPPQTTGMTSPKNREKRVPLTRLRKRIAEKLLAAQEQNALLTTFNEADMSAIQNLRRQFRDEFSIKHATKLGFMPFFVKAAVESLKSYPVVNASIDEDDVVYHSYFDIGVAVGSGKGLVVPIIKDADLLSFAEIEKKIMDFGERAQDGKLSVQELTGGTFTISNGGIYGSLLSTPIINTPQSAILGMHKIQDRPVVKDGEITIKPMMYLALTYDHRLIDGREAVQFLDSLKSCLEEPSRLLLDL